MENIYFILKKNKEKFIFFNNFNNYKFCEITIKNCKDLLLKDNLTNDKGNYEL